MSRTEPAFGHLARIHHHHVLAELGDHAEMVGDEDDRAAEIGLQPLEQADDLDLEGGVERGGRLVGEQRSGSAISAMAMAMRWRMPPENWCG
jgi:hypothetical protein